MVSYIKVYSSLLLQAELGTRIASVVRLLSETYCKERTLKGLLYLGNQISDTSLLVVVVV